MTTERKRVFRYLVAGGLATATHFLVLVLLVEWAGADPTLSTTIGFVAAIAVNYPLQYFWTFSATGHHRVVFARYLAVTLAALGLNTLLFWSLVTGIGVWYPLAQAIATSIVVVVNYTINKYFTFLDTGPAAHAKG